MIVVVSDIQEKISEAWQTASLVQNLAYPAIYEFHILVFYERPHCELAVNETCVARPKTERFILLCPRRL